MPRVRVLCGLAASVLLLGGCEPSIVPPPDTEFHSVDVAAYGLFDLGVTDADGDGRLDLYTVNHSARQSVALNAGQRSFRDVFSEWRLDQDPQFPGFHVAPDEPPKADPGVYVYWQGPALHVEAHELHADDGQPVQGRIDVLSRVGVQTRGEAEAETEVALRPRAVLHSVVRFELKAAGDLVSVAPYRHAQPLEIALGVDPERIFVGTERINPAQSRFSVFLRDRHGMAWDDVDGDGLAEIYITRGGLRAAMDRYPMRFWDELFDPETEGMREVGREIGLEKFGCPGRQAAWVDYDGDGDADIYVACGRGLQARDPNRLYRREPDGHFVEVGGEEGIDFATAGHFAWVDLWEDARPELIWADPDGLHLCTRGKNRYDCVQYGEAMEDVPSAVRVSDLDEDGDFDVFVVSPAGNRLYLVDPQGRRVSAAALRQWGLPERSLSAVWADQDHDGREELYALPGGVYVRADGGRFRRTAVFGLDEGVLSPWRLADARMTWADLDGDGARDLVLALSVRPKGRFWARKLAQWFGYASGAGVAVEGMWKIGVSWSRSNQNHWLALDIEGPPGDRASLGSRVRLDTDVGSQLRWVGHAEGARYSSGHYRVYFGLGAMEQAGTVHITWPDGTTCTLKGLVADRLYRIRLGDGPAAGVCTAAPRSPAPKDLS